MNIKDLKKGSYKVVSGEETATPTKGKINVNNLPKGSYKVVSGDVEDTGPVGPKAPASSKGFSGIGNMLTGKAPVQQVGPVAPNTVQERNNRETTRSSTPEEQKVLDKKAVQTQFDKFAGRAGNRLPIDDAVDAAKGSVKSAYQEGAGTNDGSFFGRAKSIASGVVNLPGNVFKNEVTRPIKESFNQGVEDVKQGWNSGSPTQVAKGLTGAVAGPVGTLLAIPAGGSSFVGGALKQPLEAVDSGVESGVRRLGGSDANVQTAKNIKDTLLNIGVLKGGKSVFDKTIKPAIKNSVISQRFSGGDFPMGNGQVQAAPPQAPTVFNKGGQYQYGKDVPDPRSVMKPKEVKVANKRAETIGKIANSNKQMRKLLEKNQEQGYSPVRDIAATDLLNDSVVGTKVDTLSRGAARDQYNDTYVKPMERVVSDALKKEGKSVHISVVEKSMMDAIDRAGLEGKSLKNARRDVMSEIEGYAERADINGNIPLYKIQDFKIDKYGNINWLNEAGRVDKIVGKTLKQIIQKESSLPIQKLNYELGRHLANMKFLEKLDGMTVEKGRLGGYFSRLGGLVIGSAGGSVLGGLGAAAGGMLGSEMAGAMYAKKAQRAFGNSPGVEIPVSDLMKGTVKNSAIGQELATIPGRDYSAKEPPNQTIKVMPDAVQSGKNDLRGTVFGKPQSSNQVGPRQMSQMPTSINPKTIIEGEVINPKGTVFDTQSKVGWNAYIAESILKQEVAALKAESGMGVEQGFLNRDATGSVIGRVGRMSNNPQWYRDFFKENGRKPNESELRKIAEDRLLNGYNDPKLGEVPPNEKYVVALIDNQ